MIGSAPATQRDPRAAFATTSAFQAVHVLSLVHAKQYVPAGEMTRFTAALCTALTNDEVTEAWRRAVAHYTDLKSKPAGERLLLAAILTISGEELLLVPVRDSKVDEQEVIPVDRLPSGRQNIGFSPDGNTIYYLSPEEGHMNIYAQRLSASRHAAGAPVVVQRLHEANLLTWGPHGTRVGADRIVLLMNQSSSNIWMMQSQR